MRICYLYLTFDLTRASRTVIGNSRVARHQDERWTRGAHGCVGARGGGLYGEGTGGWQVWTRACVRAEDVSHRSVKAVIIWTHARIHQVLPDSSRRCQFQPDSTVRRGKVRAEHDHPVCSGRIWAAPMAVKTGQPWPGHARRRTGSGRFFLA